MSVAVMSQAEYEAKQIDFMKGKIRQQAKDMDAIFTNEFYTMMADDDEFEDEVFGSQDEKTYRSMLNQYVAQESTKAGKGHFTKDLEKCLMAMQFGNQEVLGEHDGY